MQVEANISIKYPDAYLNRSKAKEALGDREGALQDANLSKSFQQSRINSNPI